MTSHLYRYSRESLFRISVATFITSVFVMPLTTDIAQIGRDGVWLGNASGLIVALLSCSLLLSRLKGDLTVIILITSYLFIITLYGVGTLANDQTVARQATAQLQQICLGILAGICWTTVDNALLGFAWMSFLSAVFLTSSYLFKSQVILSGTTLRGFGTYSTPLDAYLILSLGLVSFFAKRYTTKIALSDVIAMACIGLGVLVTWTRIAWIGVFISIAVVLITNSESRKNALFILSAPLLCEAATFLRRTWSVADRISTEKSNLSHFQVWVSAIQGAESRGLNGVGIGRASFGINTGDFSIATTDPKCTFLLFLTELGLPGFLALTAIFWCGLALSFRPSANKQLKALWILFLAYCLLDTPIFSVGRPAGTAAFAFLLILTTGVTAPDSKNVNQNVRGAEHPPI